MLFCSLLGGDSGHSVKADEQGRMEKFIFHIFCFEIKNINKKKVSRFYKSHVQWGLGHFLGTLTQVHPPHLLYAQQHNFNNIDIIFYSISF